MYQSPYTAAEEDVAHSIRKVKFLHEQLIRSGDAPLACEVYARNYIDEFKELKMRGIDTAPLAKWFEQYKQWVPVRASMEGHSND